MKHLSDKIIIKSWERNASPWIKAIQEQQIESRMLVTDNVIVNQIQRYKPKTVLDIGCGEGWLARELNKSGISVAGIDVSKQLINKANESANGVFVQMEYSVLSQDSFPHCFDVAACNFSLLGKESVEHVFQVIPALLNSGGRFIVQTLHPETSGGDFDYKDGWREGSWQGFDDSFCDPAPWYFRTIDSWKELFDKAGFQLDIPLEPENPKTHRSASLVMVGSIS